MNPYLIMYGQCWYSCLNIFGPCCITPCCIIFGSCCMSLYLIIFLVPGDIHVSIFWVHAVLLHVASFLVHADIHVSSFLVHALLLHVSLFLVYVDIQVIIFGPWYRTPSSVMLYEPLSHYFWVQQVGAPILRAGAPILCLRAKNRRAGALAREID